MADPPIGVPRGYDGPAVPILYPGEQMSARVALTEASGGDVPIAGWLVEPMPGWRGWWLRTRYRVWDRWFPPRAAPKLTISVHPGRSDDAR